MVAFGGMGSLGKGIDGGLGFVGEGGKRERDGRGRDFGRGGSLKTGAGGGWEGGEEGEGARRKKWGMVGARETISR